MSSTLLIDNYDSFTFNLYQLIADTMGQAPEVVRNDEFDWAVLAAKGFDRIVISPGPGRPQRAADLGISADAILQTGIPVLGVCLGHQAIAHFFGAKVGLAVEPIHGRLSAVTHQGTDLFENIPSPFLAVRYHSLAVTDLPPELEATAWAEDGTLMALRHRTRPLWGVQFHPESICSEHGAAILRRFYELSSPYCQPTQGRPAAISQPSISLSTLSNQLAEGTTFPGQLFKQLIRTNIDPCRAFERLYGNSKTAFWLDSSLVNKGGARFSYMGDASGTRSEILRYWSVDRRLEITRKQLQITTHEDIFSYLERETAQRRVTAPDVPFDFHCGYVGYFGYELKAELQGKMAAKASTPDASWIFADRLVVFDHESDEVYLLCLAGKHEDPDVENKQWFEQTIRSLTDVAVEVTLQEKAVGSSSNSSASKINLQWRHQPDIYREKIGKSMDLITQGETYEVCLTNQLTANAVVQPFAVYKSLRQLNPAPYAAFLRFDKLAVLSSSPELFLKISRDGVVESRPIKGTAPRHKDSIEDQRIAAELASCIKNRSENLMIVDLLRNDFNRVCEAGSVRVPKIFDVETYASVHQLVSTVRGKLGPQATPMDCIRAAFPGGSMTGAPKVRTMAILDDLEEGARGIYSGSLGYLSLTGSVQLNIVIRTIVINGAEISMGTGGAIVALSEPDKEFEETVLKLRHLLSALKYCGVEFDFETASQISEALLEQSTQWRTC